MLPNGETNRSASDGFNGKSFSTAVGGEPPSRNKLSRDARAVASAFPVGWFDWIGAANHGANIRGNLGALVLAMDPSLGLIGIPRALQAESPNVNAPPAASSGDRLFLK